MILYKLTSWALMKLHLLIFLLYTPGLFSEPKIISFDENNLYRTQYLNIVLDQDSELKIDILEADTKRLIWVFTGAIKKDSRVNLKQSKFLKPLKYGTEYRASMCLKNSGKVYEYTWNYKSVPNIYFEIVNRKHVKANTYKALHNTCKGYIQNKVNKKAQPDILSFFLCEDNNMDTASAKFNAPGAKLEFILSDSLFVYKVTPDQKLPEDVKSLEREVMILASQYMDTTERYDPVIDGKLEEGPNQLDDSIGFEDIKPEESEHNKRLLTKIKNPPEIALEFYKVNTENGYDIFHQRNPKIARYDWMYLVKALVKDNTVYYIGFNHPWGSRVVGENRSVNSRWFDRVINPKPRYIEKK